MNDEQFMELQAQIKEMPDEDLEWLITMCMEEKKEREKRKT